MHNKKVKRIITVITNPVFVALAAFAGSVIYALVRASGQPGGTFFINLPVGVAVALVISFVYTAFWFEIVKITECRKYKNKTDKEEIENK